MFCAVATAFLASSATLPDTAEDEMVVLDASMPERFVAVTTTLPPVEVTLAGWPEGCAVSSSAPI
ncbi:hypothetical protein CHKEEEPN_1639 [Methylorubrum podarium]|nr:hypothetical protein CHKEEEPN_1639 [Methylorubrum podarium]